MLIYNPFDRFEYEMNRRDILTYRLKKKYAVALVFKIIKNKDTTIDEVSGILHDYNISVNTIRYNNNLIGVCAKSTYNVQLLEWLYTNGCDINLKNCQDENNADRYYDAYTDCIMSCKYTNEDKKIEVYKWFESKGVHPCYYVLGCRKKSKILKTHQLILNTNISSWTKFKCNINSLDKYGNTYLHIYILNIVKYSGIVDGYGVILPENFPEQKFNINIQNDDGDTCLHLATEKYYYTFIKKLLAIGADKTIKNNDGKLPIDLLVKITDNHAFYGRYYNQYNFNRDDDPDYHYEKCHEILTMDDSNKS